MMLSTIVLVLLSLILALSLSTRTAHAFAPVRASLQQPPTTSNTQLFESIIEAEDRYYAQASQSSGVLEKPEVVYTIVYNPGSPEEGIHTMKYPRGSDKDVLLTFEGMADCVIFAKIITEDPAFDQKPMPTPTSREMIGQACEGMGITMVYVPMESEKE